MTRAWPAASRSAGSAEPAERRSVWGVRILLLYSALLPVHSLLIATALAHTGVPIPLLKLAAAWKEGLLVATLLGLVGAAAIRRERVPLAWVDGIALAWLGQVLVYLALRDRFASGSLGLLGSLYGARDWLLYLFPYFIGRLMAVAARDITTLFRMLLWVGALTSTVGVLDYLLVPTRWHVVIGIPQYFAEFLNLQHSAARWGLPSNYWQNVGGQTARRAVSVHLSGQGFALPFLLLWPLSLLNLRARWTRFATLLVILNAVALTLTFTRMTIAACFLQGLIVFWLGGRRRVLFAYALAAAVGSALVLSASIPLRTEQPSAAAPEIASIITFERLSVRAMARETAALNDPSSRVRPRQWTDGLSSLREYPAGMGLGSTGDTAARLGGFAMGSEAGYLKVAGALGYPGLAFMLGWFLGVIVGSIAVWRSTDGQWQALGALTLATATGWLINNLAAPPDQSLFLVYLFPWLAGMTVRRWTQIRCSRA
jgi:hypothetical protein